MIEKNGKYWISLPSTVLVSIVMFLIGGYAGDWSASAKSVSKIDKNTERIEMVIRRTDVIENSIQNIEFMITDMRKDLKQMKNDAR